MHFLNSSVRATSPSHLTLRHRPLIIVTGLVYTLFHVPHPIINSSLSGPSSLHSTLLSNIQICAPLPFTKIQKHIACMSRFSNSDSRHGSDRKNINTPAWTRTQVTPLHSVVSFRTNSSNINICVFVILHSQLTNSLSMQIQQVKVSRDRPKWP